jgi:insertion element IS1 protein InsB
VWLTLCRRTRPIVAYWLGDRSEKAGELLWPWLPHVYRPCATFRNFWKTYDQVFGHLATEHHAGDKETDQIAQVERWNNTFRHHLARFVRKTLSFSKSDEFHEIALRRLSMRIANIHQLSLNHYPSLG